MLGIDEGGRKAQHTQKEEGWKAIATASHAKTASAWAEAKHLTTARRGARLISIGLRPVPLGY